MTTHHRFILVLAALAGLLALGGCADRMTPEQRHQAQNDALLFNMLNASNRPYILTPYQMQVPAVTSCAASGLYMNCVTR